MKKTFSNIHYYNENFELVNGSIEFDEKIISFGEAGKIDEFSDLILLPGFVDIHTHGGVSIDWCDENADLKKLLCYYASCGVTSVCPTTMTLPKERIEKILKNICSQKCDNGAEIIGINLEGPFVSKEKCGAQNSDFIAEPDLDFLKKLLKIGRISFVDVAPESKDAFSFARQASRFTTVSLAHTNADYETANEAFNNGFSHATHLFNAMVGLDHRNPGSVLAVFNNKDVSAELICDGKHIHPEMIKFAFSVLGENRVCVVSDSLRCAGMPDGKYELGGRDVFLKDEIARLSDGTIAGSVTNVFSEFKNLLSWKIDFKTALKACTINPAKAALVDDFCGSVKENKNADFILVDKNMNLKYTFKKGKLVFKA